MRPLYLLPFLAPILTSCGLIQATFDNSVAEYYAPNFGPCYRDLNIQMCKVKLQPGEVIVQGTAPADVIHNVTSDVIAIGAGAAGAAMTK